MTALTFGSSAAPLFGFYHPSTAASRPKRAVLLCNPFGEEAIRAFRPMKKLAEGLSIAGIPTLRFDYLGTGDSAGGDELVSLESMQASIAIAHQELAELCEAREIYWVGLRLGAWAALRAAKAERPAGVLLWEPVTDGKAYLEELYGLSGQQGEAFGFPLTDEMKKGLSKGFVNMPPDMPIKLVGLTAAFGLAPILPPDTEEWNSDDALNSFTMPIGTIDLITREITQW